MAVNIDLAKSRGVLDAVPTIEFLHNRLHSYINRPSMFFNDPKEAVRVIESYEYVLQSLWGFPFDTNFHSYWHKVKGCTCPSMDNYDPIYAGRRIINSNCPYHGKEPHENFDFISLIDNK